MLGKCLSLLLINHALVTCINALVFLSRTVYGNDIAQSGTKVHMVVNFAFFTYAKFTKLNTCMFTVPQVFCL